jgi:hypothetical protein
MLVTFPFDVTSSTSRYRDRARLDAPKEKFKSKPYDVEIATIKVQCVAS